MFEGAVEAIFIAPAASAPMQAVDEVKLVEGKGLEGDRYFDGQGTFSKVRGEGRQVTLIEQESIDAVVAETGIPLVAADARRNLVTRGVPLNHLVGRTFRVGEALLEGVRLCEPCAGLERATYDGVRKALLHRAGLRADIVEGGAVRTRDRITEV
jgi:MOSC domain-containing protein YiiM